MRDLKSAGMTVDKSKFRKSMQPAVSTKVSQQLIFSCSEKNPIILQKSIFSVETSTTSNKSPDSKPVTMKSPDGNVEEKSLKENSGKLKKKSKAAIIKNIGVFYILYIPKQHKSLFIKKNFRAVLV